MPDRILRGTDAELVALQHGIYHNLLARCVGQTPTRKGNSLVRSAIGPNFFVTLEKKFDGSLVWLAVVGIGAEAAGLQFSSEMWKRHKGLLNDRKAEFVEHREPVGN